MDARTILPKCLETHYYARFNLKDLLNFIRQRMDKQIQPTTDNIIAYQMYLAVARIFPEVTTVVNMHAPSRHYVATARTGKATNLYWPDEDSDKFEWHPEDFIYQGYRDEINGTDETLGARENFKFTNLQQEYDERVSDIIENYNSWKESIGFQSP